MVSGPNKIRSCGWRRVCLRIKKAKRLESDRLVGKGFGRNTLLSLSHYIRLVPLYGSDDSFCIRIGSESE